METLLLVLGTLALIFLGMPIAPAIIIACLSFMVYSGYGLSFATQRMVDSLNSFSLLAIPFFIFAGNLFNSSKITFILFEFAKKLVGHITGGLGHVNVLVSLFFSGMSGSAIADSSGLGLIEITAMREAGYDDDFSGAITAASSIIGPIIPPSITMVLYGVLTGTSIGKLFLGGVFVGLLCTVALMTMVYIVAKKRSYPTTKRASLKEVLVSFKQSVWALLTPCVIIVGIFSGVFSPTEAAFVTVMYALLIDYLFYHNLTARKIWECAKKTVTVSASIGFIIASIGLFNYIIAREKVPEMIAEFFVSHVSTKMGFLWVSVVLIFFLGTVIESLPILMMMIPILAPIATKVYEIDPVHFGIVMVLNLMISTLTPPMGMSLLVVSQVAHIPFAKLARAIVPWLIPLVVVMITLMYVPWIATFLPELFW